jgi:hypothetical protein
LLSLSLLAPLAGCWPGRCGGALRGTPRVTFTGEAAVCTEGPACAEEIPAEASFHQGGDFARVEDPGVLVGESGLSAESWFLADEAGVVIASHIVPEQHESAHSCASAVGFDLVVDAPLAPGVYRLVLMVDRVRWPVLRHGVALSSWDGERAIVQYYRVSPA